VCGSLLTVPSCAGGCSVCALSVAGCRRRRPTRRSAGVQVLAVVAEATALGEVDAHGLRHDVCMWCGGVVICVRRVAAKIEARWRGATAGWWKRAEMGGGRRRCDGGATGGGAPAAMRACGVVCARVWSARHERGGERGAHARIATRMTGQPCATGEVMGSHNHSEQCKSEESFSH
jgi:hypothetical protein